MAAKFSNTRQLIRRTLHDNASLREDLEIKKSLEHLSEGINNVFHAQSIEEVIGIEGNVVLPLPEYADIIDNGFIENRYCAEKGAQFSYRGHQSKHYVR